VAKIDLWTDFDVAGVDLSGLQDAGIVSETKTTIALQEPAGADTPKQDYVFTGGGLTYDGNGTPLSGTLSGFTAYADDVKVLQFTHFNLLATDLAADIQNNDAASMFATLFADNDTFVVHTTAHARLQGLGGKDIFDFGSNFVAGDSADGGDGNDTVILQGNYGVAGTPFVFAPDALIAVENLRLNAGTYFLKADNGNVAAGARLTVNGGHSTQMVFNGAFETDGQFTLQGGNGNDALVGGQLRDIITGGGGNDTLYGLNGADQLTGGGGQDTFFYGMTMHSNATNADWITDFNGSADRFDLPFAVNAIDAAVTAASLNKLGLVLDAAHFGAHDAALATIGTHTYLVVDFDGVAGYTDGADLVVKIDGAVNLDHLKVGSFV